MHVRKVGAAVSLLALLLVALSSAHALVNAPAGGALQQLTSAHHTKRVLNRHAAARRDHHRFQQLQRARRVAMDGDKKLAGLMLGGGDDAAGVGDNKAGGAPAPERKAADLLLAGGDVAGARGWELWHITPDSTEGMGFGDFKELLSLKPSDNVEATAVYPAIDNLDAYLATRAFVNGDEENKAHEGKKGGLSFEDILVLRALQNAKKHHGVVFASAKKAPTKWTNIRAWRKRLSTELRKCATPRFTDKTTAVEKYTITNECIAALPMTASTEHVMPAEAYPPYPLMPEEDQKIDWKRSVTARGECSPLVWRVRTDYLRACRSAAAKFSNKGGATCRSTMLGVAIADDHSILVSYSGQALPRSTLKPYMLAPEGADIKVAVGDNVELTAPLRAAFKNRVYHQRMLVFDPAAGDGHELWRADPVQRGGAGRGVQALVVTLDRFVARYQTGLERDRRPVRIVHVKSATPRLQALAAASHTWWSAHGGALWAAQSPPAHAIGLVADSIAAGATPSAVASASEAKQNSKMARLNVDGVASLVGAFTGASPRIPSVDPTHPPDLLEWTMVVGTQRAGENKWDDGAPLGNCAGTKLVLDARDINALAAEKPLRCMSEMWCDDANITPVVQADATGRMVSYRDGAFTPSCRTCQFIIQSMLDPAFKVPPKN